jgi:hypothetical protein
MTTDDQRNLDGPFDMERLCKFARSMKEDRVAEYGEAGIVHGLMFFWRDDRPLCLIATEQDRDLYLSVARVCIPGFATTGMILCSEVYSIPSSDRMGRHPSGRAWKQGEFQELYEAGRGDEFGIKENLAVARYVRNLGMGNGRGCQNSFRELPYKVNGNTVEWLDGVGKAGNLQGWMSGVVNSYFEEKLMDLSELATQLGVDDPDTIPHKRVHADMAVLGALKYTYKNDIEFTYFGNAEDEEETEIVQYAMDQMDQDSERIKRLIGMCE